MTKLITTSLKARKIDVEEAKESAREFHLVYQPREKFSWQSFFKKHKIRSAFIQKDRKINLVNHDGQELFFHPGTALIRCIVLERGERDLLIEALDIEKDDKVLDCTAGLLNDSIVIAYYLQEGQVKVLEKSKNIYTIGKRGLETYDKGSNKLRDSFRRIEIIQSDYREFLHNKEMVSKGEFASIYFDPMFSDPVNLSPGIGKIREYAAYDSLDKKILDKALDLAKKRVVVKIRSNDYEFIRQMQPAKILAGPKSRVSYAVFEK